MLSRVPSRGRPPLASRNSRRRAVDAACALARAILPIPHAWLAVWSRVPVGCRTAWPPATPQSESRIDRPSGSAVAGAGGRVVAAPAVCCEGLGASARVSVGIAESIVDQRCHVSHCLVGMKRELDARTTVCSARITVSRHLQLGGSVSGAATLVQSPPALATRSLRLVADDTDTGFKRSRRGLLAAPCVVAHTTAHCNGHGPRVTARPRRGALLLTFGSFRDRSPRHRVGGVDAELV